jgi:hypothetical protein
MLAVTRFLSPWWWRRQVSPKRRFLQEPHGVTSQMTAFFIVTAMQTPNLTLLFHDCRFNLYLKLFIVMGINWVMELVSWAIGGPGYLWYLTDIGNTLQGVLIFIIFVWKRKILRLLARRFRTKSSGSPFSSTAYRPAVSQTSSYTFTARTSDSSHDQFQMKPVGTSCTSDVPWAVSAIDVTAYSLHLWCHHWHWR